MITITSLRFWISDRTPDDNLLIGDLEFSDAEIQTAMEHAAREFNSIPPISWQVDPRRLPDDTNLFYEATAEILYRHVLHRLMRNNFKYQAGNVVVDDIGPRIEGLTKLISLVSGWRETAKNIKLKQDTRGYFSCLG